MVYKGHGERGGIALDEPVVLSDGTVVPIEVAGDRPCPSPTAPPSLADWYRPFLGALDDMPDDRRRKKIGRNSSLSLYFPLFPKRHMIAAESVSIETDCGPSSIRNLSRL